VRWKKDEAEIVSPGVRDLIDMSRAEERTAICKGVGERYARGG
jgi:hypothetical protein